MSLSEADFQAEVVEYARSLGLLVFHSTDPRRDIGPGFPDLVVAGAGGYVIAELKAMDGRLDPKQVTWKWRLIAGGASYRLWYPTDMAEIKRELARIAGQP